MNEDYACPLCGRDDYRCKCDWPMPKREMTAAEAVQIGIRTGKCGPYTVEHGGDWPKGDDAAEA